MSCCHGLFLIAVTEAIIIGNYTLGKLRTWAAEMFDKKCRWKNESSRLFRYNQLMVYFWLTFSVEKKEKLLGWVTLANNGQFGLGHFDYKH